MPFSSRIISRVVSILALTSSLVACTTRPPSTEVTSESLLAKPLLNWKLVYQLNNISTRLSEFVPPEETDTEWTSRLSFESYQEIAGSDPIEILLSEVRRDQQDCSFVQHFNLFSGFENGFPVSVRLFLCGENTISGKGEVKMIKAIAGDDYFYLVKLLKRVAPFDINQPEVGKGEVAVWSTYLRSISLCDADKPEHPCPK
ncbi:MAG: hypothetical protein CMQ20_03030 [Gammaproteobacteria bacterium]|jgi:hypothetical protein|nr:hypothetical protein [Gammaproteobacteria bacterium]|tara:strand:+ start:246 stop:848 length:603 start_codon:yes stop_codon:yes gene_type:complete